MRLSGKQPAQDAATRHADTARYEKLMKQERDLNKAGAKVYRTNRAEYDRIEAQAKEVRREANRLHSRVPRTLGG